jgi:subtilase family serine protease
MRVAERRRDVIGQVATAAAVVAVAVVGAGALAAAGAAAASRPSAVHPVVSPVRISPGVQAAQTLRSALKCPRGSLPNHGECIYGLSPSQIRAAYDLGPLYKKGITGKGQTIVIVDPFGSPTIRPDLAHFDKYFHLPAPPSLRIIQPAGKVPAYHASNGYRVTAALEATLDVEWSHVMAPGASILLVETPTEENQGATGFPQIVQAEKFVLRHKLGQVISQSFAATEQTFSHKSDYAALRDLRGAYQLAYRDHVTVVAGSGDWGATGYKYNGRDFYSFPVVSWPASDPLVTAVGGTVLHRSVAGAHSSSDTAWNDSGGGRSVVFARPAYQNSVSAVTGPRRGVPDISMDAGSLVYIYDSNPRPPRSGLIRNLPGWGVSGGTSLAAPLFAGIVALAYQYAYQHHGHALGLINPAIYQMEARHDRGIEDITEGNNSYRFLRCNRRRCTFYTVKGFSAGPGYDLVTGVGTVNARYFVPELAKLAG